MKLGIFFHVHSPVNNLTVRLPSAACRTVGVRFAALCLLLFECSWACIPFGPGRPGELLRKLSLEGVGLPLSFRPFLCASRRLKAELGLLILIIKAVSTPCIFVWIFYCRG